MPLFGALAAAGLFYSYLNGMTSDATLINLAGRQRMLSEQIHGSVELIIFGDKSRRKQAKNYIIDFDASLSVLSNGGVVMGRELPPPPPVIRQHIEAVIKNWDLVKPVLELIITDSVTSEEANRIYNPMEDVIHDLTPLSHKVVVAYEERNKSMHESLLRKLAAIAVIDMLLLLIGISVVRQYDREQKYNELRLKGENNKQKGLHDLVNISLQHIPLSEQMDRVLQVLFDIPSLSIQRKGCIFLREGSSDILRMVSHYGMPAPIVEVCSHIPFGNCLCGKVADTCRPLVSGELDEMHAVLLKTDSDKERFILPILQGEKVLGVLSLYKTEGHVADLDNLVFLTTVTNTLASIITNKRDGEAIKTQANVIDNIHDAVVSTDMDGIVTSWNKGAERLFGHLAVDILGQSIAKLYPEYCLDDIQETIAALR
ncbi:MAG: type IV pili methyl-accepting chemotaxis transducer N-terminal domain-containing protein, partial [Gammaproteobacteria bacterium]|nr:type IV pili methyl-accepting chemotaxis transducer N-terminal domain-containing protein [Gammaproteobacteria bacterium]